MASSAERTAARSHIEEIRTSLNVDNPDRRTDELENLLNIVATQLYRESTHFLLEILQNADDNNYEHHTPTLKLTYTEESFRIDANEVGFTYKDVKAVCSAGASNKAGSSDTTGEKGLGFKAVFKVADTVWIASRAYSFKFDKEKKLGMIAPEWVEEFPVAVLEGYSTIYLHLGKCNKAEIEKVMEFEPTLLPFLRKVERIELQRNVDPARTLSRRQERTSDALYDLIIEEDSQEVLRYKMIEYKIPDMPFETKRPGLSECPVSLGFPVSGFETAKSQPVYAFLPIREYGFTFAIQANFVLIANREDIDVSSEWNLKIRDFVSGAFVNAVDYFNTTAFRYTWPRFLPVETRDFFQPVAGEIQKKLKQQKTFEGEDGEMHEPLSLVCVGDDYKLDDCPLILTDFTKSRYLSRRYKGLRTDILQHLDIKELEHGGFLTDLETFMQNGEEDFRNQSPQWYSKLSRALWLYDYKNRSRLATLKIIPLTDGNWTSEVESKGRLFKLPTDDTMLVPKGTEVLFVDPDADKDFERGRLFTTLGAETFSLTDMSAFVVRLHTMSSVDMIPRSDLVDHVIFLFTAAWSNLDDVDLWVATGDGYRRASEVYLRSFAPNGRNFAFPVLHQDYGAATAGRELQWTHWVKDQLRICEFPRLIKVLGDGFELSEDMKCIIEDLPSGEFLHLLRDHWQTYSEWLGSDENSNQKKDWILSKQALRGFMMSIEVDTVNGRRYPLKETIFPATDLSRVEGSDTLPLLDIPDPSHHAWSFLEQLGVTMKCDVNHYLQCLRAVKQKGRAETYLQLYGKIQETIDTDLPSAKNAFAQDSLIYIPPLNGRSHYWAAAKECVWRGQDSLKRTHSLENIYPNYMRLFSQVMDVKNADLDTFVTEARSITFGDQPDYILRLLQKINQLLVLDESADALELVRSLQGCAIFPVEQKGSKTLTFLSLRDEWFVADNYRLARKLSGKIPLLALSGREIQKLEKLVQTLGIDQHLLSRNAKRKVEIAGNARFCEAHTEALKDRARFVACLIPSSQRWLWKRLRDSKVYRVDEITTELTVSASGSDSILESSQSCAALTVNKDDSLCIYLTYQDTETPFLVPEIVEQLLEQLLLFFGIPETEKTRLWAILFFRDPRAIKDYLDRSDIQVLDVQELEGYDQDNSEAPLPAHRLFPRTPERSKKTLSKFKNLADRTRKNQDPMKPEKRQDASPAQGRSTSTSKSSLSKSTSSKGRASTPPESEEEIARPKEITAVLQGVLSRNGHKEMEDDSRVQPKLDDIEKSEIAPTKEDHSRVDPPVEPSPKLDYLLPLNEIAQGISNMKKQERREEITEYNPLQGLQSQPETLFWPQDPVPLAPADPLEQMLPESIAEATSAAVSVKGRKQGSKRFLVLDRVLERSKGLRLTGLNDIIYLPTPDELPQVDSGTANLRGVRNLPARLQITKNGERVLYIALEPGNAVDLEPTLLGEVKISRLLADILGDAYQPDKHWTSPMRRQLNHAPFQNPVEETATFTVDGDTRPFTDLLIRNSIKAAEEWRNHQPVYHIEVRTSTGGLHSKFTMSSAKVDLARKHRLSKMPPDNVFILIRIHDINTEPGISFFIDPWRLYNAGRIDFQVSSAYMANIGKTRPHISLTEQAERGVDWGIPVALQANGYTEFAENRLYRWKPLKHERFIRVLRLSAGHGNQELTGALQHVSLDDNPKYLAISYAWGSKLRQFKLKTDEGSIPLTLSLYLGLWQLRRKDRSIDIWADAISINQNDNDEKECQVRLMQDIFRSAVHVYAWLGQGDSDSSLAIEALRKISASFDADEDAPPAPGRDEIPPVEDPSWVAINKLFRRKWFRRVWIVQEVILSSQLTLVCGDDQIPWEQFYEAAKYCDVQASNSQLSVVFPKNGHQSAIVSLGEFKSSYEEGGLEARQDLHTLLRVFKLTESTTRRDKLFALLSLAKDGTNKGFSPDYKSRFKDVVLQYAKVFVEEQNRGIELLYQARLSVAPGKSSLPSWIPSWTSPTAYPDTISTWAGAGHFRAGTDKNAEMQISKDILSVRGQIVDSVTKIGKWTSTTDMRRYLGEIFAFIDGLTGDNPEERQHLKWKVPIGAATKPTTGNWGDDAGRASFGAMAEYLEFEEGQDDSWKREQRKIRFNATKDLLLRQPEILLQQLWPYLNTAMDFAEILSPAVACLTRGKRVGIVPRTAEEGDVVAVFHGCAVPFLLRRRDGSGDHYQVVGECYVHGMMHGEALSTDSREEKVMLV